MTTEGELTTRKGDFIEDLNSILSFNKSIAISYSMDITNSEKLQIKMYYPDGQVGDVYQMIFVLKGSVQIENKGCYPSKNLVNANQHNLYYIRPGNNTVLTSGVDDDVIFIALNKMFVNRYLPDTHPLREQLIYNRNNEPLTMAFTPNMAITVDIWEVLQHFSQSSSPVSFSEQLIVESKVIELLAHQIIQHERLHSNNLPYQLGDGKRERMQKIKEIIVENTGKQLPLKTLAHMVGTNEFDLKRDFKIVFGHTVYGYLKHYKMELAKSILLSETLNVGEISQKLGYKHATHFTSAFKKYFGYLPSKLRVVKVTCLFILQAATTIINCFEVSIAL